eukprot:scaffold27063_cov64-Phaeocystis_antarctica.AAC.4
MRISAGSTDAGSSTGPSRQRPQDPAEPSAASAPCLLRSAPELVEAKATAWATPALGGNSRCLWRPLAWRPLARPLARPLVRPLARPLADLVTDLVNLSDRTQPGLGERRFWERGLGDHLLGRIGRRRAAAVLRRAAASVRHRVAQRGVRRRLGALCLGGLAVLQCGRPVALASRRASVVLPLFRAADRLQRLVLLKQRLVLLERGAQLLLQVSDLLRSLVHRLLHAGDLALQAVDLLHPLVDLCLQAGDLSLLLVDHARLGRGVLLECTHLLG